MNTVKLSNREMSILRALSLGQSYESIRETMNNSLVSQGKYPSVTKENIHTTCFTIRKKTGIRDTRDPQECRSVLRQRHSTYQPEPHRHPTHRQMEVLRLLERGTPYREIAEALKLTSAQSVQNYASQACKRMGIKVPAWQRTQAIREWLNVYDARCRPLPSHDPMSDPAF